MSDRIKINLSDAGTVKNNHWIRHLFVDFAIAYDIRQDQQIVKRYICTPYGCQEFVKWLVHKKFNVAYWELAPYVGFDHDGKKYTTFVGFGIEFDPHCERIVEYKLRGNYNEDES